jgi:hypothetical protein
VQTRILEAAWAQAIEWGLLVVLVQWMIQIEEEVVWLALKRVDVGAEVV